MYKQNLPMHKYMHRLMKTQNTQQMGTSTTKHSNVFESYETL